MALLQAHPSTCKHPNTWKVVTLQHIHSLHVSSTSDFPMSSPLGHRKKYLKPSNAWYVHTAIRSTASGARSPCGRSHDDGVQQTKVTVPLCLRIDTPLKFNIAPEKWWLEDYFPIGKVTFRGYDKLLGVCFQALWFQDGRWQVTFETHLFIRRSLHHL